MSSAEAQPATTMPPMAQVSPSQQDLKRKRSPSHERVHSAAAPPPPKSAKTSNHLQINYLARHCDNDLPLITNDDNLPGLLSLLSDYQGVLDRHESMACNLGARPLGPILIKRFERLFDGPPRVLKSHGKEGTSVSWLDVVEFARNKPEQFQLGQMSEGVRVCQFYTKQCRVQISEEDHVLISSGIPQKMIPPQPILEDEDKELGTLEILEKNLGQICQLADQVAARTRQLNHRLKGRKQAILDRRATASPAPSMRPSSPSNVALMNHVSQTGVNVPKPSQTPSISSPVNFTAVNPRPHAESGASSTTRHELMSKFRTSSEHKAPPAPPAPQSENGATPARRQSISLQAIPHASTPVPNPPKPSPKPVEIAPNGPLPQRPQYMSDSELHHVMHSPVPIPNTPSSLLPVSSQRAQQSQEKDDGGPFKLEMVHRMESLAKGERILPPCDRCRRLHMDCLKNLTACMGCTKKHAKCSWKEVREGELRGEPFTYPPRTTSAMNSESEENEGPAAYPLTSRASTNSPPMRQRTGTHTPLTAPPPQYHDIHGPPLLSQSPPIRNTPHQILEYKRDRSVDIQAQLQEAAKSSLAHANTHLSGGMCEDSKPAEYQPLTV